MSCSIRYCDLNDRVHVGWSRVVCDAACCATQPGPCGCNTECGAPPPAYPSWATCTRPVSTPTLHNNKLLLLYEAYKAKALNNKYTLHRFRIMQCFTMQTPYYTVLFTTASYYAIFCRPTPCNVTCCEALPGNVSKCMHLMRASKCCGIKNTPLRLVITVLPTQAPGPTAARPQREPCTPAEVDVRARAAALRPLTTTSRDVAPHRANRNDTVGARPQLQAACGGACDWGAHHQTGCTGQCLCHEPKPGHFVCQPPAPAEAPYDPTASRHNVIYQCTYKKRWPWPAGCLVSSCRCAIVSLRLRIGLF